MARTDLIMSSLCLNGHLDRPAELPPAHQGSNPSVTNATAEQMNRFDQLLAALSSQPPQVAPYALADILTLEAIGALLDNDPSLCAQLAAYLPPGIEATPDNVRAIVRSADFRYGVRSLDAALRSGTGNEGLRMFFLHGLGLEAGWEGVEEYVEAVQKKG